MDILFIGNSYTYYNDMPALFERLANDNGKSVSVCSVTQGGRKLIAYQDPTDPVTAELDAVLAERTFDVCFIQEQSVLPAAEFDVFLDGLACVVGKVSGKASKSVLYATWGRKQGHGVLAQYGWTTESMTDLLSDAYQKAAAQIGACVSPVGTNFLKVVQANGDINLYDADLTHPSYAGSCLAALTHYHTVFGEFPQNTTALELSETELTAFRTAVGE